MSDWTPDEQRAVKRALLGSWPGTITQWGRDAFAAYVGEMQARGLSCSQVLVAIRTWPAGSDFPPSAPNLAAVARRDPSRPTASEAIELIFGAAGALAARTAVRKARWDIGERERLDDAAALDRAATLHPLIAPFIRSQGGARRLRGLNLTDPEWGAARRRTLAADWDAFVEAQEGRAVAAIVSGRRGELAAFDPLAALGAAPAELSAARAELPAGEAA